MTGFLTPQGCEDGCCNGESNGLDCNCFSGVDQCGNVSWQCFAPRDPHGIPTKAPHNIRIVKVNESGDTILSVVHETTATSGDWRPSVSGWYRVEICCQDPGYGECVWENISILPSMYADVSPEACGLSVAGVAIRRGGVNGCLSTADIYAAATLRFGDCPEGISSLTINGNSMLPPGPPAQVAGCLPDPIFDPYDATCGSGFAFVATCAFPSVATPHSIPLPAGGSVRVKATSHCGDVQICDIQLPCQWAYNAVAAGVPAFAGSSESCSGGDAKPPGWDDFGTGSGLRWKQSWSANFSLPLSWGGTYVPLTCVDAPLEAFEAHRTLGEATFTGHYEESGLVKFLDPVGNPVYHPYTIDQTGTLILRGVMLLNYSGGGALQGLTVSIASVPGEALSVTDERLQPIAWNNAGSLATNTYSYPDARFNPSDIMRVNPTGQIGCQLVTPILSRDWDWEKRATFPIGGILVGAGAGISPFNGGCPGGSVSWIAAGTLPVSLVGVSF